MMAATPRDPALPPVRLHQNYHRMAPDGSPEWTVQFEHWIHERTRERVATAQRKWRRWWEDDYVLYVLGRHFNETALDAVIHYQAGTPLEEIARHCERSPQWVLRWNTQIENYVRFALSPRHERPSSERQLV